MRFARSALMLALVLAALPASAKPAPENVVKAGVEAWTRGDYATAIRAWEAAAATGVMRTKPHPIGAYSRNRVPCRDHLRTREDRSRRAGANDSHTAMDRNAAANGNDGITSTRWCAANGAVGHYWTLDLGAVRLLSRFEVMWEYPNQAAGLAYGYVVSVSNDGATFTPSIDRSTNTDTQQIQTSDFPPSTSGRHVRITVTSLPASTPRPTWASFYEARVFGQ